MLPNRKGEQRARKKEEFQTVFFKQLDWHFEVRLTKQPSTSYNEGKEPIFAINSHTVNERPHREHAREGGRRRKQHDYLNTNISIRIIRKTSYVHRTSLVGPVQCLDKVEAFHLERLNDYRETIAKSSHSLS